MAHVENSMAMVPVPDSLPDDVDSLKQSVIEYATEVELLREQLRLLRAQLYGRKSERMVAESMEQLSLFVQPEFAPAPEPDPRSKTVVGKHERKKPGRGPLPEDLPREEIVHDIPDDQKLCDCGHAKECIGSEDSERLDYVPAKLRVLRHKRLKYVCKSCESAGTAGTSTIVCAPAPLQMIPKGIPSAGLLAHVFVAKYVDALPFHRQEAQFERLGIELKRATMCNWLVKVAVQCAPLLGLIRNELLKGPLIGADETTLQVLDEPGRDPTTTSYLWVFRGGDADRPCILFLYSETRADQVPKLFLDGYHGGVQTDGYVGYDFLDDVPDIEHFGCWAHARRMFDDVLKSGGKSKPHKMKGTLAEEAMVKIQDLYLLEKRARKEGLVGDALREFRKAYSKPRLTEFHAWLVEKHPLTPPKGLTGKAIAYTLGQWDRLVRYADTGHVRMDNNLTENTIRPIVVGRKNWLFSGTPEGAHASAAIYSLVETAKANGLDPYRYLRALFEHLPRATTEEAYRALLPQYMDAALMAPAR